MADHELPARRLHCAWDNSLEPVLRIVPGDNRHVWDVGRLRPWNPADLDQCGGSSFSPGSGLLPDDFPESALRGRGCARDAGWRRGLHHSGRRSKAHAQARLWSSRCSISTFWRAWRRSCRISQIVDAPNWTV